MLEDEHSEFFLHVSIMTWSLLLFLLTQVGSRIVIVAGGCVMLLTGMFGKVGAVFASIPTPVIGGMFIVMFGVITAVGVSNLQVIAVRVFFFMLHELIVFFKLSILLKYWHYYLFIMLVFIY